eukprot:gene354-1305_t
MGVRPGPLALVRDAWEGGTPPNGHTLTESCLVGGYTYHEEDTGGAPDGQGGRQSGMAPAPYPFETNIIARDPAGGVPFSLIGGVVTGGTLTPITQSLDMHTVNQV